jgi:hypothetical protein
LLGKVNAGTLGDKVAMVECAGIGRNQVDFSFAIEGRDAPTRSKSTRGEVDHNCGSVLAQSAPLALDLLELAADLDHQVIAATFPL